MLQIETATAELRKNLGEMVDVLKKMTETSVQILETGSPEAIQEVIEKDRIVDGIQRSIDRQSAELLALINPMASDFRFVFAVLKMNVDMERIGDQCKNIVKDFHRLSDSEISFSSELIQMAHKVKEIINIAFTGLMEKKTELARDVLKRDVEIDALELVVINKAGCSIPEIMIARSLERIADHATNIAENLVYAIEGVDIRDLREKYKISSR